MTTTGNPHADDFAAFVRSEVHALTRSAYLLTGDRHHAEDLVQTALSKLATRWTSIETPDRYVRKVLYHQAVSWWRYRGRRPPEALGTAIPETVGRSDEPDTALVLRQALARLTAKQRAVLVLRYFEDRTEADTAAVLGCAVGTVKSQTRHALRRIKELAPELADLVEVTR